jgi:hypothetical protein
MLNKNLSRKKMKKQMGSYELNLIQIIFMVLVVLLGNIVRVTNILLLNFWLICLGWWLVTVYFLIIAIIQKRF